MTAIVKSTYFHFIARVDSSWHTYYEFKMSGFGDEHMENTDTTFKDIPIEHEVDNPGVLEIYRKMMLIDLFQTEYGGWVSNLPLHIKVVMAAMLVTLLTAIAGGIYFFLPLSAGTGQQIGRTKPTRIPWRKCWAKSLETITRISWRKCWAKSLGTITPLCQWPFNRVFSAELWKTWLPLCFFYNPKTWRQTDEKPLPLVLIYGRTWLPLCFSTILKLGGRQTKTLTCEKNMPSSFTCDYNFGLQENLVTTSSRSAYS